MEENSQVRKLSILAVEDEETTLRLYQKIIGDMGHNLVMCRRGSEALEKIGKEEFACIILDLKLPDIHGVEILKAMEEKKLETPIVIITAFPTLASSIEAIRMGQVYDYIIKPFDSGDLQMVIKRALEKAVLMMENRRLLRKLESANEALLERVEQLEHYSRQVSDYDQKVSALEQRLKDLEKDKG